jgi:hypothetical protein
MSVDVGNIVTCGCSELDERFDGKNVLLVGMIGSVRTINTKKGDQMAFVQIEDMGGQGEVVVFPRTYAEVKEMLVPDSIVMVKGKAQTREGQTSVLADSFQNYVDQILSVGPDPQYQKPLLDVIPTINGLQWEESRMSDDSEPLTDSGDAVTRGTAYSGNGFSDMASFGSDDDDSSYMEENPFANEPPAWLRAEMAGGAAPLKIAAKPSTPAPTMDAKKEGSGKEEAAPDNPYLHESRNLREEDGDFDIALPKHLQSDPSQISGEEMAGDERAKAEMAEEPSNQPATEEAAPANPYLHESRNLREEDGDFEIALPKHLQGNPALLDGDGEKPASQPLANDDADGAKPTGKAHANGHPHGQNGTNGHSNGKSGNGHNGRDGQNGQSNPIANGRRTMQILFRPSGDVDRDKYRLKQIVEAVRDPKGRDQFTIVIKASGKNTTLAFPDDPCSISDRLRTDLSKFFRVDVQVKE